MERRWSDQHHFKLVLDPPEHCIRFNQVRFLGQVQTSSLKLNTCKSGKRFITDFQKKLENLEQVRIRGEYKLWIYKRYMVPSFHFALAVNPIPETAIKKMQAADLMMIKRWLNLPKCFTTSALHHPNVIDIHHCLTSDLR